MSKKITGLIMGLLVLGLVGLGVVGCGQGGGTEDQSAAPPASERTISGFVKNIFSTNEVMSSITVCIEDIMGKSESDGSYSLTGVSPSAETISAAAPGSVATTIQLIEDVTNIPVGYPTQWSYYSDPTETTLVKGRLVDEHGDPVVTSFRAVLGADGYSLGTSTSSNPSGNFTLSVSTPKNIDSLVGYLSIVKEIDGVYKGVLQKIDVQRGVTLEVGDIVVAGDVATISGAVTSPSGYRLYSVSCGVQLASGLRMSLDNAYYWSSEISGESFSVRLPATPAGEKYYVSAFAVKSGSWTDMVEKYETDLILSGGEYTYNLTLPAGFLPIYPTVDQENVSNAPRFEWVSMGDGYVYMLFVGNNYGLRWWGLTSATSIEYPSFPVGSGGEVVNLADGNDYFWRIIGFKIPDIDMTDIQFTDFYFYTETVQFGDIPFKVGSASVSSVKSFDVHDSARFDQEVGEFLEKLGVKAAKKK